MTTFLFNHSKIQQLQSRLNKNQYLSNQCLPNFIDAIVFKSLKTSNQIPKRQIYPHLYHWYVLMRQFADRTLDHWLKNDHAPHFHDSTISEVVSLINQKNQLLKQKDIKTSPNKSNQSTYESQHSHFQRIIQKQKRDDSLQSEKEHLKMKKAVSCNQKKISVHGDLVTEYLMSIKLTSDLCAKIEDVKKFFDNQKYFLILFIVQKLNQSKYLMNQQIMENSFMSEFISFQQIQLVKSLKIIFYALQMFIKFNAENREEIQAYEKPNEDRNKRKFRFSFKKQQKNLIGCLIIKNQTSNG